MRGLIFPSIMPSVVIYSLFLGTVITGGYLQPLSMLVYHLPKSFLIRYFLAFSLIVGGNLLIYPIITAQMAFLIKHPPNPNTISSDSDMLDLIHGISNSSKQRPKNPQSTVEKLLADDLIPPPKRPRGCQTNLSCGGCKTQHR